jgi:hypothetical protein
VDSLHKGVTGEPSFLSQQHGFGLYQWKPKLWLIGSVNLGFLVTFLMRAPPWRVNVWLLRGASLASAPVNAGASTRDGCFVFWGSNLATMVSNNFMEWQSCIASVARSSAQSTHLNEGRLGCAMFVRAALRLKRHIHYVEIVITEVGVGGLY